jgi:hypothetical protein
VESGAVTTPLWDSDLAQRSGAAAQYKAKVAAAAAAGANVASLMTNQQFVREYVRSLIQASFANLKP